MTILMTSETHIPISIPHFYYYLMYASFIGLKIYSIFFKCIIGLYDNLRYFTSIRIILKQIYCRKQNYKHVSSFDVDSFFRKHRKKCILIPFKCPISNLVVKIVYYFFCPFGFDSCLVIR